MCKIHSTITDCPIRKHSSLYKHVLLVAEGYHKSNYKEMFLLRAYRTVMDITRLYNRHPLGQSRHKTSLQMATNMIADVASFLHFLRSSYFSQDFTASHSLNYRIYTTYPNCWFQHVKLHIIFRKTGLSDCWLPQPDPLQTKSSRLLVIQYNIDTQNWNTNFEHKSK